MKLSVSTVVALLAVGLVTVYGARFISNLSRKV